MSLLPVRFQTSDDMPMSLGRAIAREIAPKVDPNAWFEMAAKSSILLHGKDFKGAAQEHALGAGTDLASAPVAAPPSTEPGVKFKVGQQVKIVKGSFTGLAGELSFIHGGENPMCHVYVDGKKHVTLLAWVEPAPSPDAETVGDGWVLVTMDAPDLKEGQYDWRYTDDDGCIGVTLADEVGGPLRGGSLACFAKAGDFFYRPVKP